MIQTDWTLTNWGPRPHSCASKSHHRCIPWPAQEHEFDLRPALREPMLLGSHQKPKFWWFLRGFYGRTMEKTVEPLEMAENWVIFLENQEKTYKNHQTSCDFSSRCPLAMAQGIIPICIPMSVGEILMNHHKIPRKIQWSPQLYATFLKSIKS